MELCEGESLYAIMLRAGGIRKQAQRLHSEAETLENIARMKFEDEGGSTVSLPQTPGMVLVVAYGGPANGCVTRVTIESLQDMQLIGPAPAGSTAMTYRYEAAMIVRLQNFLVGALVVPKGKIEDYYEALRADYDEAAGPKPVALAIARMLTLSIGFNPEMVIDLFRSAERGAKQVDDSRGSAMFLQVGVPE